MNGYEKASRENEENTLFPTINPSDQVLETVWREYHLNRFWSRYTEREGNGCPSCRSSEFIEEERQLDYTKNVLLVWYRCSKCGQRWNNEVTADFKA